MKSKLIAIVAAVLVVGCGESQQSAISIYDAAFKGNIEAVKQHIAAGTDVNAVGGLLGWTPLHFAAAFGHKEIVKLLVAKVADANTKVEHGFTPLHYASWYGHKEVVELLIGKGGADVNVKVLSGAKQGYTPLDFAFHNHRMGKSKGGSGSSIYSETADLLRKHGGKTGEELKAAESNYLCF